MTDETPRRRRRASAPAGSPSNVSASVEVVEPPATPGEQSTGTVADLEPPREQVDGQPAKRRSQKPARKSKKAADAPAEADSSSSASVENEDASDRGAQPETTAARADGPEHSSSGPKRPRRKSAAQPKDKPGSTAESASEESSDAGKAAEQTSGTPNDRASELDVLAALGETRPGAAPLFKAPEPVSRRAQAPAGPPGEAPKEVGADSSAGEDAAAKGDGADDAERAPKAPKKSRKKAAKKTEPVEETDGGDEVAETDSDDGDVAESGDEGDTKSRRRRRRRGGRGRRKASDATPEPAEEQSPAEPAEAETDGEETASSRRRRRRRGKGDERRDEVTALKGSTRLEAKRQRRREGRDAGRRRSVLTEAEFLARRESVERTMVVREAGGRVQIGVLEDGVLVEHFVSREGGSHSAASMIGNVYLGRVQNVLPSMEAAFVDIGRGRNAVLYAGEVNWDAAGLEGQPRRIEDALKSGDSVLVQVTKDPVGHKGARLTSQVTLAGRYLVYVPGGGMTGISRKLPDTERSRLKKLLKEIVPEGAGVIVRTAAEGASEEELRRDVQRLTDQWAAIDKKRGTASAPALLQGEPDLAIRVVRDIFNDDFASLTVQGDSVWKSIREYVTAMAPDLVERLSRWTSDGDVFAEARIDEQLAKAMDRKVWLPSGGSLVIDRTEAMTVIDVNTGKFTGSGGTLEETVTRNNLEAAEEIVRQLRLRDIGGIIVIDFIDMVLESNRDLVLRRLVESLGRDRTKHQVAEVTSLGLVQMTRKRVGQGLVEAFSETCQECSGRGFLIRNEPVSSGGGEPEPAAESKRSRRKRATPPPSAPVLPEAREDVKATLATIAAAAAHAHEHDEHDESTSDTLTLTEAEAGPADAESDGGAVSVEQPELPMADEQEVDES